VATKHTELPDAGPSANRRHFLVGTASGAGAFILGTVLDIGNEAKAQFFRPRPNLFVEIRADDKVIVTVKHLEMGQGVTTGIATIIADELDAAWGQMDVVFAPVVDPFVGNDYANFALNLIPAGVAADLKVGVQATGSSSSMSNSWVQLRRVGAAMRAMLVKAAAGTWNVPEHEIGIASGIIGHANSGKQATFGAMAQRAMAQPVPLNAEPKPRSAWVYIGKPLPRIDSVRKTTGVRSFAMDRRQVDTLTAMVIRPRLFGAKPETVDASPVKNIPGTQVLKIPQGFAVLASDTWSALKARHLLDPKWNEQGAERRSTSQLLDEYRALAAKPGGKTVESRGNLKSAFGQGPTIEHEFTFPNLAHAPMEPLNAVIEMKSDGSAEVWAGSQFPTMDRFNIARTLGVLPHRVRLNTEWAGGSFGRRATVNADYLRELAEIGKAAAKANVRQPIHLIWTREDDIRGGRYRPMVVHRVRAKLDGAGKLFAWEQRVVGQSFLGGSFIEDKGVKFGADAKMAVEGAADMPYAIPNFAVSWRSVSSLVPTLWWRSVSHSHTAYVVEVMMDMLAREAKLDPVEFRVAMLANKPRHVAVLRKAAEAAGFGAPMPPGRGRGIALHASFKTIVAMVADVTVLDNRLKVDRVVAAVDCGTVINPDVVRAQIEGGIGFALGAALRNRITLKNGEVEQSNFHNYEPLRMSDMPKVEVHIMPSDEPPTGIGEPGVPPVAPAVANAVFAATGKRALSLPFAQAFEV